MNYIQLLLFCNIYSALQKYWNSKDKIALLAVESTYLQIWLKDEWANRAILSSLFQHLWRALYMNWRIVTINTGNVH